MDGIWLFYLILAAFPGVIIFAVVYKYVEVARAARWPSTPGRIVASGSERRDVDTGGPDSDDTETRNFAMIVYEYTVAGHKYRCDRVSIGENMGNFEVAETIARYPVGKTVTVYYNPGNRAQAVLERDLPPGIWKTMAILVLVLVIIIVGSVIGFRKLGDVMSAVVPDPRRAPFVTACIGFALVAALVIFAIQRSVGRMRAWPTVPGRIDSSGVHAFEARDSDSARWITQYRSNVVYSYEVGGVGYTGDKVGTTGRASSNIPALVRRGGARYPAGTTVKIHYNPDNPAESILDPRVGPLWLLWLIPATVLVLAYFVAQAPAASPM